MNIDSYGDEDKKKRNSFYAKNVPLEESFALIDGAQKSSQNENKPVPFEDALALAGIGKFNLLLHLACGCCFITMMTESLSATFLIPATGCDFNLTTSDKGLLSAIFYIGMITSSYTWGFIADTKGRKKALIVGMLLDSVCAIIASFAPTFSFFIFMRFLNGFFACVTSNVTYAYLGEFFTTANRTKAIMWLGVFIAVGSIALSGFAWLIIPQTWSFELPSYTYNSWRVFVIMCGMPGLIASSILGFCLPESPKYYLSIGKQEECLQVLRHMYSMNTGKHPETYSVKCVTMDTFGNAEENSSQSFFSLFKTMGHQTALLFRPPNLKYVLIACVMQFLFFGCTNSLALWIADMFNHLSAYYVIHPEGPSNICEALVPQTGVLLPSLSQLNTNENSTLITSTVFEVITEIVNNSETVKSSVLDVLNRTFESSVNLNTTNTVQCVSDISEETYLNTMIYGIISGLLYVSAGYVVKYLGKKTTIYVIVAISVALSISMLFVVSSVALLLLSSFYGAFLFICIGSLNIIVVEIFPTHLRAMAVSLTLMIGRLGTVCGSYILGILLEAGCESVFYILAGAVIVAGSLTWFLPKPGKEMS